MEDKENNEVLAFLKRSIGKTIEGYPSKFGYWFGGVLKSVEKGSLVVEYTITEEMTNAAKTFHGGAIAAILDDLMGLTVASLGSDSFYATVNLSVDYLSGGQIGELVTVTTKINREGRSLVNAESVMVNSQGKILAKATSNLFKTTMTRTSYQ